MTAASVLVASPTITTLEELLPHVHADMTCKEFGAAIIRLVPAELKFKLALATRDALGKDWSENSVRHWLSPNHHSERRAERHRGLSRRWYSIPENAERSREASRENSRRWRSVPENAERNREASLAHCRENRLDTLIRNCCGSSRRRGHSFTEADEAHLRELWARGERGELAWSQWLDFKAFGIASETGGAGHPWAPSFDRIDNSRGYTEGNCELVPNCLNVARVDFDRTLVDRLLVLAHRVRAGIDPPPVADPEALRAARVNGRSLHTYIAGLSANVFRNHPALIPHRAEMMAKTKHQFYGSGRCALTGLPFVAEAEHPQMQSWDWAASGTRPKGDERPEEMRLICRFANHARMNWPDSEFWLLCERMYYLTSAAGVALSR